MWPASRVPERYVLVGVCFLAAACCYLDRVGFPLAYTKMAAVRGRLPPCGCCVGVRGGAVDARASHAESWATCAC